jgi:hypothetical protein
VIAARRYVWLMAAVAMGCGDDAPGDDPTLVVVRYEPDGEGFYRMPWPSDARLTDRGTPDLRDFPQRRGLLDATLSEVERAVRGFATMPVAYFALTSPVGAESLPQGVEAMSPDSPIQLLDVSEAGCGERVPLEVEVAERRDALRDANLLQVATAPGWVLVPGRPHAVVVLGTFGSPEGRRTPRPDAFDRALSADPAGDALARSLAPLARCLPDAGVALEDVAVATVFTPQDPVEDVRRIFDFVVDPGFETRPVRRWRVSEAWSRRRLALRTHEGVVDMPVFQEGASPYVTDGGAFVFDAAGAPVVQRWEEVDIAVAYDTRPMPEPRPVLVFMDGTGWEPWSHLHSNWVGEAIDRGYVVMSFMPQFHGGRAGFSDNTEIASFNIPNPPAGRTNFQQQAIETSYFLRLIRDRIAGLPGLPPLDVDNPVYGGQSQGAVCGSMVAALDPRFRGFVFNGLSAFLTETILHRMDVFDFRGVVATLYGFSGSLDRFHPLLSIVQTGAESTDPHNYVRLWHGWVGNPGGAHAFVSNGFEDATTTPRGMSHMTLSAGMPPIAPPGWDLDPLGLLDRAPVTLPVQGNETASTGDPLTLATYLDAEQGHGTIYRRTFARELALGFWDTARAGGPPRLSSVAEFLCGDGADGDEDGMVDCADPDCDDRPPCVEGPCDNGVDDDGNGAVDCADPACADADACRERDCGDGSDDDGDGAVDCADVDCATRAPCAEQRCGDRIDDDGDGDVDCADAECADDDACHERRCADGRDDDGDGLADCADPECATSVACPEPVCDDGLDENDNGLTDCADPGCAPATACMRPIETTCTGGSDDDGDGAVDCADADCAFDSACPNATCADADLGSQVGLTLYSGTLEGASNDYPPGDCLRLGVGGDAPDVALFWTAPADGDYLISTRGSEADTILSVLAPTCDPVAELACNDDEGGGLVSSAVTLTLTAGEPIVIVVGAYDAEADAAPVTVHVVAL